MFKNKTDCLIIDFSHDNINTYKNFPEAFKKYYGEIYSQTNLRTPQEELEKSYNYLKNTVLYKQFFKKFLKSIKNNNIEEYILNVEKEAINFKEKNEKISETIYENIYNYFHNINVLNFIFDISEYRNEYFELFFKKISNIFKINKRNSQTKLEIEIEFASIGKISEIENIIETNSGKTVKENSKEKEFSKTGLNILDKLNEIEKIKEKNIEKYKNDLNKVFSIIIEEGKEKQDKDIEFKINTGNFKEEEILSLLIKGLKKFKRGDNLKDNNLEENFINILIEYKELTYIDLYNFIINNN